MGLWGCTVVLSRLLNLIIYVIDSRFFSFASFKRLSLASSLCYRYDFVFSVIVLFYFGHCIGTSNFRKSFVNIA